MKELTFHTADQVKALLVGLKTEFFTEKRMGRKNGIEEKTLACVLDLCQKVGRSYTKEDENRSGVLSVG